jgi:tripartite-type tricarboxylate transporter receptor subunit TctC
MKLPHRRQFLRLAAAAAALPAVSHIAKAQAYPTRPVRIMVGFAAGGAQDILARLIGQWLSERLGHAFTIENRPGGGGNIATEAVVRAAADGIHASHGQCVICQKHDAIRQPQFHFSPGRRTGGEHHELAQYPGRESVSTGQDNARIHYLC